MVAKPPKTFFLEAFPKSPASPGGSTDPPASTAETDGFARPKREALQARRQTNSYVHSHGVKRRPEDVSPRAVLNARILNPDFYSKQA